MAGSDDNIKNVDITVWRDSMEHRIQKLDAEMTKLMIAHAVYKTKVGFLSAGASFVISMLIGLGIKMI